LRQVQLTGRKVICLETPDPEGLAHLIDGTLPDWRDRQEELKTMARDIYWCHERMAQ